MYVATGYSLGSGRGDSLQSPARVKKTTLLQQQMLSKPRTRNGDGVLFYVVGAIIPHSGNPCQVCILERLTLNRVNCSRLDARLDLIRISAKKPT